MKVLIVNTFDRDGGAARSARRLHWALRGQGVESRMLVMEKTGDDPHTMEVRAPVRQALRQKLPLLDALPQVPYRNKEVTHWSNTFLPGSISHEVEAFDPDVVHLHWINRGFLNVKDLAEWGRPVVWTLHDCWPFTGGCHYPAGTCEKFKKQCGACPALGSNRERDLSRRNWDRKQAAWEGVPLTIVGPSRWLTGLARESSLFRPFPCQAIPNAIDTDLYRPGGKTAVRKALGLPLDIPLILMVAMNPHQDKNKGGALALEAVRLAADRLGPQAAELLLVGQPGEVGMPELPWKVRNMGILKEEADMVRLYQAADLQVVPSYLENLSNALMEAGACGLPRVAFRAGGNSDLVEHGETGFLAEPYQPSSLAEGLCMLLEHPEKRQRMGEAARSHILGFSEQAAVAVRHMELYQNLTDATP